MLPCPGPALFAAGASMLGVYPLSDRLAYFIAPAALITSAVTVGWLLGRIVDARRHPMANCFSAFKQHFSRGQGFSYDLGELGRYYRDYVLLMEHYDAVLPGRVHRVYHEQLLQEPESTIRALLKYCGLEYDAGCLSFHDNPRAVRTASSEQVRRPLNTHGVDTWRNYEQWLGPLRQALGDVADRYPFATSSITGGQP